MQTTASVLPTLPRPAVRSSFALLLVSLFCLAFAPLRLSASSLTGVYESEGTIVETSLDYAGPVSLPGLLGLEFDLGLGVLQYATIARVEIEQRDRSFTIRTKNSEGVQEWSGMWERNGGFEPTKEGVKLLIRAKRFGDDFFMFTLSTVNEGAVLIVDVQRVQASKFGPVGKPVGKFLFLRVPPSP